MRSKNLTLLGSPFSFVKTSSKSDQIVEPIKKKHRASTSFLTNRTASIALPSKTSLCQMDKIKKMADSKNSTFTISSFLKQNLLHDVPPSKQIEMLETKCKSLRNQTIKKQSELDKLILQKVELTRAGIKEHAARRVDLFFYLLLTVYKKDVIVTKESTIKQHGRGSKSKGTQACHSSLFPNIKLVPTTQWSLLTHDPTLSGTQFEETLNMTVELPNIVNAFDGHLEGRYQPTKYVNECLNILNEVSKGTMSPQEGMSAYFKVMNIFFSGLEKKYFNKNKIENTEQVSKLKEGPIDTPDAFKKVWEYEKEGTFLAANEDMTLNKDYLYLMLRLNQTEICKVKKSPELLPKYYKRIQEEILSSKSEKSTKTSEKSIM